MGRLRISQKVKKVDTTPKCSNFNWKIHRTARKNTLSGIHPKIGM